MKQIRKPMAILISLFLSGIFAPLFIGMEARAPGQAYAETSPEELSTTPTPSTSNEEPQPSTPPPETEATETSGAAEITLDETLDENLDGALDEMPDGTPDETPDGTPDETLDGAQSAPPENEIDDELAQTPPPPHYAELGDYETASAEPGGALTLILPVRYIHGVTAFASNADSGGEPLPYVSGRDALQYDQALAGYVLHMEWALSDYQPEGSPLAESVGFVSSPLVVSGVNCGYAVFEQLQIREDAQPGAYSLSLSLVWRDFDCDEEHKQMFDISVLIEDPNEGMEEQDEASSAPELDCNCCVHCTLCYDENGEPSVESCACVDEQGIYTGCSCNAPCSARNAAMPEEGDPPENDGQDEAGEALQNGEQMESEGQPENTEQPEADDTQTPADDCTCGCNIQIAPTSIAALDGPIVFTFAELKAEMERPGVSVIYLGFCDGSQPLQDGETINNGNIKFPTTAISSSEILLPSTKTSMTIIGTDPRNGKRVTLTDNPINGYHYTIHTMTNGQSITLRDMDIVGYSEWGILTSGDTHTNVRFQFENVSYSGVQMSRSLGSGCSVTITDSTVLIRDMNVAAQEVAESREIILAGESNITRQSTTNHAPTFSMFWLKGSPYLITVRAGATITLQTTNYLVYDDGLSVTNILIESGATLDATTTGAYGCLPYLGYGLKDLTIRSGGSLRLSHQNSAYNTLMVNKLTVEPGASLEIDRQVANSNACIGTYGVYPTISVNNPKLFVLQNAGANGRLFATHEHSTYTFSTPVINLDVSGVTRIWNNQYLDSFSVNGTLSAVSNTSLEDGYGASPIRIALNTANFNLYNASANRLIMGDYSLSMDPLQYGASKVTGSAPGGSTQTISEYRFTGFPLGAPLQQESGVGGGSFSTGEGWQPLAWENVRVYVQSKLGSGLYALAANTYRDAEASLALDVPDSLEFKTTRLANYDQVINRVDADWAIKVYNGLPVGANWILSASIAEPLHTPDYSDSLPGALMFVLDDMMYPFMPNVPQLIAESAGMHVPVTTLQWPEEEGFHVFLPGQTGRPDIPYSTVITWTLSAAP